MTTGRTKKRGPGEGTVYRDKASGGWRWKAPRDAEGSRESGRADTYDEARLALRRAVDRREQGLAARGASQTLTEYLGRWLDERASLSLRHSSLVTYRRVVDQHLVPAIGSVRVTDLSTRHIARLQGVLKSKGLAPASIEQAQAVLRAALEDARRVYGLVSHNVAKDVPTPRRESTPVMRWTDDEVTRLLKAAKGERLQPLYVVAAYTGLRLGELLGLRWRDVDLDGRQLHVRTQLQRQTGRGLVLVDPKSDAGRRDVPIGEACVEALQEQRTAQDAERNEAADWADEPSGLVFTTSTGRGLGKEYVNSRLFHRIRDRAGVRPYPFKTFRATVPTMLAEAGVSPRVVQELMGHSDITTTLRYYTAVSPESKQDAAALVAARLEA